MEVIKAQNIGKRYRLGVIGSTTLRDALAGNKRIKTKEEDFWALKDISFEVKQGSVLGIIGRNGAGKSTLLKILSKITYPTTGRVEINGRLASLLEVGTGFHPELTGKENIFLNGSILGMKRREIRGKFDEIVSFSGVEKFLETPVKRYSSGMYVRLAFAVAAHLEPEILVIDEVLAVGDAEFQAKCLGKMNNVAKSGRTVIFVSHNMAAIKNLCSEAILLDKGKIKIKGSVDSVVHGYLNAASKNVKRYDDQLVTEVSINQETECILLKVKYDLKEQDFVPILGFTVHKNDGDVLFTHSMRIAPEYKEYQKIKYPKVGEIKARITEPKLMDGVYNISVFLGNGAQDFFVDRNCVSFEVAGMTNIKQMAPARVGYIAPECTYDILL